MKLSTLVVLLVISAVLWVGIVHGVSAIVDMINRLF